MLDFRFTRYFEREVLRKRPYLSREMCIQVIRNQFALSHRAMIVCDFGLYCLSWVVVL